MKKIANKDAAWYVSRKEEFKGSNLRGEWIRPDIYAVYSYETPIYVWSCGESFVNRVRYSATTSRHVSYCQVRTADWEVLEADLYCIINHGVEEWRKQVTKELLETAA